MNRPRPTRTLRFRLGITLGLLTVVVTLCAPLLSVVLVRDHLNDRAAQQLLGISDRIEVALSSLPPVIVQADQLAALLPTLAVFVAVDDTDHGHLIGSDDPDLQEPAQEVFVSQTSNLEPGKAQRISVGSQDYTMTRIDVPPITILDGGETIAMTELIIGLGHHDNDVLVQRLLWYTVAGAVVSMIVVGGVGAYLLRRGLRPLEQMAQAAAGDDLQSTVADVAQSRSGTEITTLATAFEKAFAARQDAEDRMRNFVADASHELRAPVTTMSSWIDHYLQGGLTDADDVDRMVARMEAETGRIRQLLDEMTLLARTDAGVPFDRADVDVAELVSEVVADAQVVTPDRQISFESSGTTRVQGDSHRLRQVFGNLVGNAQEHTANDRAIEVVVTGGDEVRVEVRDHGDGIPADQLAHLFDRFWRADPGRDRTQRHSGLGLAIVKSIVEAHHGQVWVTSEIGIGTVVTVCLPGPETVS